MAKAELQRFSVADNELAAFAKALAHPARVAIIRYLSKVNGCVCGDIVDVVPLAQSTVSQHLRELKNAGLIRGEIDGTSICYCLNSEAWERLSAAFNSAFESTRSGCC